MKHHEALHVPSRNFPSGSRHARSGKFQTRASLCNDPFVLLHTQRRVPVSAGHTTPIPCCPRIHQSGTQLALGPVSGPLQAQSRSSAGVPTCTSRRPHVRGDAGQRQEVGGITYPYRSRSVGAETQLDPRHGPPLQGGMIRHCRVAKCHLPHEAKMQLCTTQTPILLRDAPFCLAKHLVSKRTLQAVRIYPAQTDARGAKQGLYCCTEWSDFGSDLPLNVSNLQLLPAAALRQVPSATLKAATAIYHLPLRVA